MHRAPQNSRNTEISLILTYYRHFCVDKMLIGRRFGDDLEMFWTFNENLYFLCKYIEARVFRARYQSARTPKIVFFHLYANFYVSLF